MTVIQGFGTFVWLSLRLILCQVFIFGIFFFSNSLQCFCVLLIVCLLTVTSQDCAASNGKFKYFFKKGLLFQVPTKPVSAYIISPFCLDIRALEMQKSFQTEQKGGKVGYFPLIQCSSMNSVSLLPSVSRKLRGLDIVF